MPMHFANKGHDVTVADNYLRRTIAQETNSKDLIQGATLHQRVDIFNSIFGKRIHVKIGDCADASFTNGIVQETTPDTVIHFAEQPSAPYSIIGKTQAQKTFYNNLEAKFNLVWAILNHSPDAQLIKLGTMGAPALLMPCVNPLLSRAFRSITSWVVLL